MGHASPATIGPADGLRRRHRLALALALGFVGTLQHDLVEFGGPSLENSVPAALLFATLFAGWWRWRRARPAVEAALLVLATTLLLGGAVVSVVPLAVWPFVPEQTPTHYATHLIWFLSLAATIRIIVRDVRPPT